MVPSQVPRWLAESLIGGLTVRVGDTLTVATALGPAKALPSRREYVEMALLPSAQGLAMEPYAADLAVTVTGDLVSIARPEGLALSPTGAAHRYAAADGAPQPASMPALINYQDWPKTGSGGFLARYDALMAAAASEVGVGCRLSVLSR